MISRFLTLAHHPGRPASLHPLDRHTAYSQGQSPNRRGLTNQTTHAKRRETGGRGVCCLTSNALQGSEEEEEEEEEEAGKPKSKKGEEE